jgi:hypothetical protein
MYGIDAIRTLVTVTATDRSLGGAELEHAVAAARRKTVR